MAGLDPCGCCTVPVDPTPAAVWNRPGLQAIAYRVGTFASFRQTMLAELVRELPELTTRALDDHAITLLELWAAVGDVLTFYQERLANEAFLRTAVQRDSVRMLAALLDYRPRPGLSAEADLALTLDEGAAVTVPAGVRVMSLPGAGEQPQIFETLEACAGRAALNRLKARPVPQADRPLSRGRDGALLLDGGPGLAAGDRLALFTATALEEKRVVSVAPEDGLRRLTWTPALTQDLPPAPAPTSEGRAMRIRRSLRFFGWNLPDSYPIYDPGEYNPATKSWTRPPLWKVEPSDALRALPDGAGTPADPFSWPLEGRVEGLAPGARLLVAHGGKVELATVRSVSEAARALGPLKDTVTVLTLSGLSAVADRRAVQILEVDPAPLEFRPWVYPAQIAGGRIALRPDPGVEIERHRRILIDDGHGRVHAARVSGTAPLAAGDRAVDFTPALPEAIVARDAVLLGNVARAGHGETQAEEILGDGDGAQVFQSWTLAKADLSRRPSAQSVQGKAELAVMVDGVRWDEADSLYGQRGDAPVYILREQEDARTRIRFGDGRTGARLPSGRGNVVARYRRGLGLAGLVGAGKLNVLLSRPPGLRDATNPAPAEGGADPEDSAQARQNAPVSVRTFGRIVALDDFAWLATASGEIAKAKATWVWRGLERSVHLTVAAQGGGDLSGPALARLHAALDATRDPNHALIVANALRVPIRITAKLVVLPGFVRNDVVAAARAALLEDFSFQRAELGRALHASQVIAVLQATRGVDGVDLDALHFRDAASWTSAGRAARGASAAPDQKHLRIFAARAAAQARHDPIAATLLGAGVEVVPAELATLAEADLELSASGGIG
jgi:hypothetical protein